MHYKEESVNHALYKKMNSVEDIAVLMEYHVAVSGIYVSLGKPTIIFSACAAGSMETSGDTPDKKVNQLNCFRRGRSDTGAG